MTVAERPEGAAHFFDIQLKIVRASTLMIGTSPNAAMSQHVVGEKCRALDTLNKMTAITTDATPRKRYKAETLSSIKAIISYRPLADITRTSNNLQESLESGAKTTERS